MAIFAAAYVLPGVSIPNFTTAIVVAIALGVLNSIIKPILILLTLPLNIMTLGLFTFVINAGLILLAANFVPGFSVNGFWWALILSLVLAAINFFLHRVK
jgi:putative membrane protein